MVGQCQAGGEAGRLDAVEVHQAGNTMRRRTGDEEILSGFAGRVALDHDTARRLFTLICALQART